MVAEQALDMKILVEDETGLLHEVRLLFRQRPRFGSGRICQLLKQRGWTVNEKRVHRVCQFWSEKSGALPVA